MDRLVMRLDLAVWGFLIQVLEGGETNHRIGPVEQVLGRGNGRMTIDEMPSSEVDVAQQVVTPRCLDRGLVGQDEDPLPVHLSSELVSRECLTEAHLRVPQESRSLRLADSVAEVGRRAIDR